MKIDHKDTIIKTSLGWYEVPRGFDGDSDIAVMDLMKAYFMLNFEKNRLTVTAHGTARLYFAPNRDGEYYREIDLSELEIELEELDFGLNDEILIGYLSFTKGIIKVGLYGKNN